MLYGVLYSHQKTLVGSSFSSFIIYNYLFRIFCRLFHLLLMQMPSLPAGMFVFLMCCAYLLAFLAISEVSCLPASVFIACYTSHGRFVDIGFYLICLSAFIHFVIGLLIFAFF